MAGKFSDAWYYPPDIAHDLDGVVGLSDALKQEAYACAWEYTRCVIPQYTNWKRYVGFMRTIIIGIIAEFKGDMVDVVASDDIMGLSLESVLSDLFGDTPWHEAMSREYRSFLLVTSHKASEKRHEELFRRYVNGLAKSPRQWFRMRDCDALARFTLLSALACNDLEHVDITDDQLELLAEIGDTLYDAVAFFKHRSEGETNSTFAYVPGDVRISAFRVAREVLWAIDAAYARKPGGAAMMNFVRFFGGPIHMMMRRYRFVEEGLTIGRAENSAVVAQTRRNVKLWNRVDADGELSACHARMAEAPGADEYRELLELSGTHMFPGLRGYLEAGAQPHCNRCVYRPSYGAKKLHSFGGVEICVGCRAMWRGYVESLPERVAEMFPDVEIKQPPGSGGDDVKDKGHEWVDDSTYDSTSTGGSHERGSDDEMPKQNGDKKDKE